MYVPIGSKLTVSFKGHPVNGLNTPWLDTAWNPTTGLPNPEGQGYSRNAGFHAPENGDFEDSATVLNNASGSQNRWVMVGALPSNTVHAGEWLDVRGCRESFPSASVRRWLGEAPE